MKRYTIYVGPSYTSPQYRGGAGFPLVTTPSRTIFNILVETPSELYYVNNDGSFVVQTRSSILGLTYHRNLVKIFEIDDLEELYVKIDDVIAKVSTINLQLSKEDILSEVRRLFLSLNTVESV